MTPSDLVPHEALARGRHPDPFAVLGPHASAKGDGVVVRVLRPGAKSVSIVWQGKRYPTEWVHGDGVLEAHLPGATLPLTPAYRIRVELPSGEFVTEQDPYRFPPILADADFADFARGVDSAAHERLGAHLTKLDGVNGVHFSVWAPNAERVAVIGGFNAWSGRSHGMRRVGACGVWEIFVPGVREGALYKFEIRTQHGGRRAVKADPFGRAMELRPNTASVVAAERRFRWGDSRWTRARAGHQAPARPLSVYEVHLGSWRRRPADNDDATAHAGARWLDWDELADTLVPYVKEMGFTHVELMPITEHPFDGSWGYQATGYFAPTSRFGTPDGLRRFVDVAHRAGIGVLLDWVPAHFPRDAHGPAYFDGTHLFEYEDPLRRTHPDWETYVFDWSRGEVRSFLISSALYWLEQFHLDGLRVDAVASMLYLDYSRKDGEWRPNAEGGRENWDAVGFLRQLNEAVHEHCPGALTLAEESTAWPGVTAPVSAKGLGFDYKWNMGWMNDTLSFFRVEPRQRARYLQRLTFSLTYAFSERHLLPLSHDEVVHGKGSLLAKMPGTRTEHFANLRTLFGLMWAHPGRKLLFMGCEFAPWTEWNHDAELEWGLLEHAPHRGMREWVKKLNELYRKRAALHAVDDSWDGFEWVEFEDPARCALAFVRRESKDALPLLVVANLSPKPWKAWPVGVPREGRWRAIAHSDDEVYGGAGEGSRAARTESTSWHGRDHSLVLDVPALSISYWVPVARARAGGA